MPKTTGQSWRWRSKLVWGETQFVLLYIKNGNRPNISNTVHCSNNCFRTNTVYVSFVLSAPSSAVYTTARWIYWFTDLGHRGTLLWHCSGRLCWWMTDCTPSPSQPHTLSNPMGSGWENLVCIFQMGNKVWHRNLDENLRRPCPLLIICLLLLPYSSCRVIALICYMYNPTMMTSCCFVNRPKHQPFANELFCWFEDKLTTMCDCYGKLAPRAKRLWTIVKHKSYIQRNIISKC